MISFNIDLHIQHFGNISEMQNKQALYDQDRGWFDFKNLWYSSRIIKSVFFFIDGFVMEQLANVFLEMRMINSIRQIKIIQLIFLCRHIFCHREIIIILGYQANFISSKMLQKAFQEKRFS